MEKISLVFLGTANAIPTKKRNHSAILLSYKNENILIDCGEGTQRQFRFANLSLPKITKILITHWHGDHILGLPGLFQTLAMSDYHKTLEIYGPRRTKEFISIIEKLMARFKIKLSVHELESGTLLETKDFKLSCLPMSHGIPSLAYSFEIKDKRRLNKSKLRKLKLPNSPLLKKLAEGKDIIINNKKIKASQVSYLEKGRKITIILDTKYNENTIKLAKNSDILISEASFSKDEEKTASEYLHLTASQAAVIAKKARCTHLILTHISQRYEHNPNKLLKEAKAIFKNTTLAYDLQRIEI